MSLLHPSTLALLVINSRVFFVVDDCFEFSAEKFSVKTPRNHFRILGSVLVATNKLHYYSSKIATYNM